jgi:hypothetical protein
MTDKLKRYYLRWKYGYVLATSKKELMEILKTEHNSWFVEPYWFRPHEVLEVSEIKPAAIKDCKDWNEEIDWLNECMTEEESK